MFVTRHRTVKEAEAVEQLLGASMSDYEIARRTGISRGTISWTQSSHKNISIANRRSVELLDSFVGPKR